MGAQRVKNPFTLLEIAFTILLAPLLLLSLIKMATHLIQTRHYLEKAHNDVHSKLLIQERLSALLSSIQPGTLSIPNEHTLTFVTQDLLDPDPAYSGAVPVKLFLENHTLTLQLADRPEILMENMSALFCEIIAYSPDHPSPLAFLRLTLTPNTFASPLQFAFFFNNF